MSRNRPSPFKDETNINVFKEEMKDLPTSAIYDAKGSTVYNQCVFMSPVLT
ncbi:MAG: hypothetical protein IPG00_03110 [Saprospiraceae bacterium]|nr:hypothetical protein [Saprospiraceae bacterium]